MSATNSMNVQLTGKTLPGADIERAAAAFAKMAGLSPAQARAIITCGKARAIKQGIPPETAQALVRHFAGLGIEAVAQPTGGSPDDLLQELCGDAEAPAGKARTKDAPPQAPRQAQAVGAYCTNCGAPVAAQAPACHKCGFNPRRERKFCHNCGTAIDARQVMCVKCGVSLKEAALDSLASMAGGATKKATEFLDRHKDAIDALAGGAGDATKKAADFIDRHKDKVNALPKKRRALLLCLGVGIAALAVWGVLSGGTGSFGARGPNAAAEKDLRDLVRIQKELKAKHHVKGFMFQTQNLGSDPVGVAGDGGTVVLQGPKDVATKTNSGVVLCPIDLNNPKSPTKEECRGLSVSDGVTVFFAKNIALYQSDGNRAYNYVVHTKHNDGNRIYAADSDVNDLYFCENDAWTGQSYRTMVVSESFHDGIISANINNLEGEPCGGSPVPTWQKL